MLGRILALSGEDAWSDEEVLGLCFLFTLAGLDTVSAAIGFVMLHLARNAELRGRVVTDAGACDARHRGDPAARASRADHATSHERDIEVCWGGGGGGVAIPAGSPVMLCLATANREAGVSRHPDEVDLERADRNHLSFGGGIHRCLGAHLARRELRLVVEEFHKVIPDYEVAAGFEPEIVWPSGTFHLRSLSLVFPATTGDQSSSI